MNMTTWKSIAEESISYSIQWFTQINRISSGYSETIFLKISDFLTSWNNLSEFDADRKISSEVHTAILLIEYIDRSILESDRVNNTMIKLKNSIQSEPVDDTRQIWESIGDFEWNGKHYLLVYTYNSLTEEICPERGTFKGVIVDYEKYVSTRPHAIEVRSSTSALVKGIL
jgi:hypothetical protein